MSAFVIKACQNCYWWPMPLRILLSIYLKGGPARPYPAPESNAMKKIDQINITAGTNPFNLFQGWYDEAVAVERRPAC